MRAIRYYSILFSLLLLFCAYSQESDSKIYISPNNDGVKDALEFSLQIKDRRYVQSWAFIIENEAGEVVRTIENKDSRPEMETTGGFKGVMKSIWRILTRVKRGVAVPDTLRWDGIMDSGAVAPDGKYFFHIIASDDNGNESVTDRIAFYVDNTAPEVFAFPPHGADGLIFSPDGDRNKDTFEITQGGSVEDIWEITVFNAAGAAVREETVRGDEPSNFVWDGKDSSGRIVPDGIYSYRIAATDRAGNKGSAEINNIIVNTVQPTVGVAISARAFSPNGDGVKDTIDITPRIPVTEGLQRWTLSVVDEAGEARRVFDFSSRRGGLEPQTISFDGKDASGSALPEGRYTARLAAEYANGHQAEAASTAFLLDVTAPSGSIEASTTIFSPVGGGGNNTVTFTQEASTDGSWVAQIVPAGGGEPVRTLSYGGLVPPSFEWNGRDDLGAVVPDGLYEYVLTSTDEAGNTATFRSRRVSLSTEKADLILQASGTAFSPNGDGRKDTVTFTPVVRADIPASSYSLEIRNEAGSLVRTFAGEGAVPARFVWDGTSDIGGLPCPDGAYTASLSVTLVNMQSSSAEVPAITLDTQSPSIEASAQYLLFSPNEQSARRTVPIAQSSSDEALWRAEIRNSSGDVVRSYTWQGSAEDFEWDARDNSGNLAADDVYSYTISCEDEAGNMATYTIDGITLDSRAPQAFVTAQLPAFSPNGDTVLDTQTFSISANIRENIASWALSIVPVDADDESIARSWGSDGSELPESLEWDGKAADGSKLEGRYRAILSILYEKGEEVAAITPIFLINATPPELAVRLSPRFFSPDNDGIDDDLYIDLSAKSLSPFEEWSFEIREPEGTAGRVFWQAGGKGTITERIIWDGRSSEGELVQAAMDYPYTFTVKDTVGMTSTVRGYVPVDVLVIRDGDNLKIAVPSIIFARDVATFDGLAPDVIERNNQILRRVAEILNRFKSYNVVVEGHANNVTGTEREETNELIPLSKARAEAIKVILQKNGVSAGRLSTVGMGGTRPVAAREDRDNWWKNRRVEFILRK